MRDNATHCLPPDSLQTQLTASFARNYWSWWASRSKGRGGGYSEGEGGGGGEEEGEVEDVVSCSWLWGPAWQCRLTQSLAVAPTEIISSRNSRSVRQSVVRAHLIECSVTAPGSGRRWELIRGLSVQPTNHLSVLSVSYRCSYNKQVSHFGRSHHFELQAL